MLIRSARTGPPNVRKRRPVSPPDRLAQYCALARWRVVLPSCLDRVTSWHLFRLARDLCKRIISVFEILWKYSVILLFGYTKVICRIYSSECLPRVKEEGLVAMLWRFLTNIPTVRVVARRTKARTLVWRVKTLLPVSFVQLLLQNS